MDERCVIRCGPLGDPPLCDSLASTGPPARRSTRATARPAVESPFHELLSPLVKGCAEMDLDHSWYRTAGVPLPRGRCR
jgi:hypothetical protein